MFKKKTKKVNVLFVDDANDLQSQIAEYFVNSLHGDMFEAHSAGPHKDIVDCDLISEMYQEGFDIRRAVSKDTSDEDLNKISFDYVVFLQESTFEEIGSQVPGGAKVVVKDFGSRKDFKATDDAELYGCYAALVEKVRCWVEEAFSDVASLDAMVR
jgi:arsenate reductase (thioredoxin)